MEELKNAEINGLLSNYSKQQLAEKVAFYEDLMRSGNVYLKKIPQDHYSVVDLLEMSTGYDKETLSELLNCGFETTANAQSRSIEKYCRHRHLLNLSGQLAQEYQREYQCCSPRVKGNINTNDILNARSNVKNVYPSKFIDIVKKFLEYNPIEEWHNKNSLSAIDTHFTEQDNEKFECNYCKKCLKKKSRKKHLETCKKYKEANEEKE